MSGHSKWSTIKRQKGIADIKRGQTFTKIANVLTIATKVGGSTDPGSNPRLRVALEAAKKINMPKENIQRAIERGLGKLPGQALEEISCEGFGPAKVAFYLEGVTDNKLRTNQEIKSLFERAGGSLGESGSTAYLFDKKGEIKVQSSTPRLRSGQELKIKSKDEEILELIDLGAEEIEDYDVQKYLVYVESPELNTMSTKITQSGFEVESSEMVLKPNTLINISDPETAKKVLEFAAKLEERDDIQKVYANFDIPEELV